MALTTTQKQIIAAWRELGPGLPASEYRAHIAALGHRAPSLRYVRMWTRACETVPGHTVRVRRGKFERVRLPYRSMSDASPSDALRHARSRAAECKRKADAQSALARSLKKDDAATYAKLIAELFDDFALYKATQQGAARCGGRIVPLTPSSIDAIQRARHVATTL